MIIIEKEDNYDFETSNTSNSLFPSAKVEVTQEKISDVPENEQIKLNDDTIYRFSCTANENFLKFRLSEIGAFAPYIYEKNINLDGMREIHSMFNSCNDLKEVQEHIIRLFNDKKISLSQGKEESIILNITAHNISEIQNIKLEIKRKMTSEKDESLLKLYDIEKKQSKLWKEIESYAKKLGKKGDFILNKMKEIDQKFN